MTSKMVTRQPNRWRLLYKTHDTEPSSQSRKRQRATATNQAVSLQHGRAERAVVREEEAVGVPPDAPSNLYVVSVRTRAG